MSRDQVIRGLAFLGALALWGLALVAVLLVVLALRR